MRTWAIGCFLTLVFALAVCTQARARLIRAWTTQDLWKEADLVAIACVKSATRDTPGEAKPDGRGWVAVETRFEVVVAAKGKVDGSTFALTHFRLKDPHRTPPNGPEFVRFDASPTTQYLLFLKRVGPSWEAVSGPWDPKYSVRTLQGFQPGPPVDPRRP